MAKWINRTIVSSGFSQFSNATHLVLCSGQPGSIGDVFISTASVFLLSIKLSGLQAAGCPSILVSYLSGEANYNSLTVSFATTSAYSADYAGTATHVAVVSGLNSTLQYVTTCTNQQIAVNVPYFVNPFTINVNGKPT